MGDKEEQAQSDSPEIAHGLHRIVNRFVQRITALSETLPVTMSANIDSFKDSTAEFGKLEENEIMKPHPEEERSYLIKRENLQQVTDLIKLMGRQAQASLIIPQSYLVSLVSQYDAFLGELLGEIYVLHTEFLDASDHALTLGDLVQFDSIEEAREFVLEKEVERTIRKSHADQFEWMEKKFGLTLRKDLPIWPVFIEVTERRNLFVHTGGVVSRQYLHVCELHSVKLEEDIELGTKLSVDPEYFENAYSAIFEIGVKLASVLWRKHLPNDLHRADRSLIEIGFDTLYQEDYELTKVIFEFATQVLRDYSSEENRRIMLVNCALAYKWSGDPDRASHIVEQEDWSAMSPKFRLAEAAILDRYPDVLQIMKEIGTSGEVAKEGYRNWPLFKEIRGQDDFVASFEEIFEEPFSQVHLEEDEIPPLSD